MVAPEDGHLLLGQLGWMVTLGGLHSPYPVSETHTKTPLCGLHLG